MAGNKDGLGDKGQIAVWFFYIGELIFNSVETKQPLNNFELEWHDQIFVLEESLWQHWKKYAGWHEIIFFVFKQSFSFK